VGLSAFGGFFPVQTLKPIPDVETGQLHDRLTSLGVKTVLHRARNGLDIRLSFLITTLHSPADIDRGVDALQRACAPTRRQFPRRESILVDYRLNGTVPV